MKHPILPKVENADKGFHYTVSEEQIKEHQKRSVLDIFEWLEKTNKFIFETQTPEERKKMKMVKNLQQ